MRNKIASVIGFIIIVVSIGVMAIGLPFEDKHINDIRISIGKFSNNVEFKINYFPNYELPITGKCDAFARLEFVDPNKTDKFTNVHTRTTVTVIKYYHFDDVDEYHAFLNRAFNNQLTMPDYTKLRVNYVE